MVPIRIRHSSAGVLLAAALCLCAGDARGQGVTEGAVARVAVAPGDDVLRVIAAAGIPAEDAGRAPEGGIQLFVTQAELARLRGMGLGVTVLDADASRTYAVRAQREAARDQLSEGANGSRFHLGSMGGFLTLAEVEAELDSMRRAFPSLISYREAIGVTAENRTLWSVRITRNPDVEEPEPRILYTALHHAREPQGMMVLLHTMWHLLEHYGADEEVTDLLDHRELTFIPVVNPDGYVHNQTTHPDGGGMWRRNRSRNADGSFGVDLNRNYGHAWGADNIGSSGNPSYDTYRGTAPFSEPETQAIRALCIARGFTAALNYHSYGNVLITPWGYANAGTPDSTVYRRLGTMLTAATFYDVGTSVEVLGYETNGDADDWMYGDTVGKPAVFALTPEVGSEVDGFWPPPSRIAEIAAINLRANLTIARLAGEWYRAELAGQEQRRDNDTVAVTVRIANAGLLTVTGGVNVQLAARNAHVIEPSSMFVGATATGPIPVRMVRSPGLGDGERIALMLRYSTASGRSADTLVFRSGVPSTVFFDGADSGRSAWIPASSPAGPVWDTTSAQAFGGRFSYTDSPGAPYVRNGSSTLRLLQPLDVRGAGAELRYQARWDIEPQYDAVFVEASVDGGAAWVPLRAGGMRTGSGLAGGQQPSGVPLYDRRSTGWMEESLDLDGFTGPNVLLRFRLASDAYVQRDGFYVDDIRVLVYRVLPAAVRSPEKPLALHLAGNYPNPFNGQTRIRFTLQSGGAGAESVPVVLTVVDLLGREVAVLLRAALPDGEHTVLFDARGQATGMYLCRLQRGGVTITHPMMLIR